MAGLLDFAQLFGPNAQMLYNGDNQPSPGLLSLAQGLMPQGVPQQQPQAAMAQQPNPMDAMAQAAPPAPPAPMPEGPGLLQRLAGMDSPIGGMANFVGQLTGQTQRGVDPERSQGPAGQAYRLMLSKGVDPATAKLMASSREMATAWMSKNIANDQYQPVMGPDGKPIAQKNITTGKIEADPRVTDSFEPVKDDAGRVIGQRNLRSGKVESDPRFKTDDLSIQTEERKRAAETQGLKPGSPAYQSYVLTGKMPREDQQPLTATDKKAIMEADEAVLSAQTAVKALGEAKKLSKEAYFGPTAGPRGYVTSLWGDKAGEATENLTNTVTTNALGQLKAIFGAAPTEGERKILLDIQGSVNKSPAVREEIYDRAMALAERRLQFNKQRSDELRGGSYYKTTHGAAPAAASAAPDPLGIR